MNKNSVLLDRTSQVCIVVVALASISTVVVVIFLSYAVPALPMEYDHTHKFCLEDGICGEESEVLHEFFNRTINQRFDRLKTDDENNLKSKESTKPIIALKTFLKTTYWKMTPAARVVGDPNIHGSTLCGDNILCMSDVQPILYWRHTGRARDYSVFLRFGVKYKQGRLVVPVDGTYYVYSYLYIREGIDGTTNDVSKKVMKHAICKFNILDGRENEIMARSQLRHDSIGSGYKEYNSHLSSVVRLKAGDELSVNFSNVSYLVHPLSNYFGVNLI